MKLIAILLACSLLSGCATSAVSKLRKKIPVGYADTLNASVTTIGGWGGDITGKNVQSEGRGKLSADEYSENINSPWASFKISLTGAGIGKKKVEVKPDEETK